MSSHQDAKQSVSYLLTIISHHLIPLVIFLQIIESSPARIAFSEKPTLGKIENHGQTIVNPHILSPGQSVRREVAIDDSHLYQIDLPVGKKARLTFDAQNISLTMTLFDPNQRKVCELTNRRLGPTPLSLITNIAGVHTLEIRLLGGKLGKGDYLLTFEQLGQANVEDKRLIDAERMVAEANRLREEWKADSFKKSINKYEEALSNLRGLDNAAEEAYILRNIGDVYSILGNNIKAAEYFIRALESIRKTDNRQLQIEILNDLANINIDFGKKQAIIAYCDEAQKLSSEIGYVRGEARALNNRGGLFSYVLGDKEKALDLFNQALRLYQEQNDYRGQAQSLSDLGYTHSDLGNIKEALVHFSQALQFWQALANCRGEALTLTAMGLIHNSLGETQKALDYQDKAIQLFQIMGNRIGEAVTLNGMAYIFDTLSENHKSLHLYTRALELYRAAGRRSGEAITMGLIGRVYEALGNKRKALNYHHQRLRISKLIENGRVEAHALRDIGVVLDALGNKTRSIAYYNKSLSISRVLRDPRGEAYTLNCIGYVYDKSGQKRKALEVYKQALNLLQAVEDRAGETLSLHNITRVAVELGELEEARDHGKRLIEIVETLRAKVVNQELRTSYFASAHQHYKLYIDVLMRMHKQDRQAGYNAAALEVSEKARGRSLLDLLNESGTDIRQGIDQALLQQERDFQRLLNSKAQYQTKLLNQPHTETQASATKEEIANLTSQYESVRAKIRAVSPQYGALTQPQTLKLEEIQRTLDDSSLLLEYSLGDDRSYLWAVTTNSLTSFELPNRAKVEEVAKRLYRLAAQRPKEQTNNRSRASARGEDPFSEASFQLSSMLLGPVANILGTKQLIIVADGALQYVPFGALLSPATDEQGRHTGQSLISRHEIVSLPSISIIPTLRKESDEPKSAMKTLAILADPVFEKDDSRLESIIGHNVNPLASSAAKAAGKSEFSKQSSIERAQVVEPARGGNQQFRFQRLPFSRWEAKAIADFVPENNRLLILDFEANLASAVSTDLQQYKIVHFATHAIIYGAHPQLYGIVLSQFDKNGNPQDGFLRLNEIYNLRLLADLIVLSACQTAIGKEIKGEGLVGLTHGFMYAGANCVLASLWQVDDRASAELMKYFYEAMFGPQQLPPPKAFQAAQVRMSKHPQWSHPYYWAGFLLQGEWRWKEKWLLD